MQVNKNFNYFYGQNFLITPHYKIQINFPILRFYQFVSKDNTYKYLGIAYIKDDCYVEVLKHFDINGKIVNKTIPQLIKINFKFNALYAIEVLDGLNNYLMEWYEKYYEKEIENENDDIYSQKK